jgi:hypothetical protein
MTDLQDVPGKETNAAMSLQIVPFAAFQDQIADVEAGIRQLFAAVEAVAPPEPQAATVLGDYRMLD